MPAANAKTTPRSKDFDHQPMSYRVPVAVRVSGIGKSRLYDLMAKDRLKYSQAGKVRLIHADSLRKLVEEGF